MNNYRRLLAFAFSAAFAYSTAHSAEVEFTGNMDFDLATYYDKDFSPFHSANHDINLGTIIHMDERFAVELYATTYTTVLDTATGERMQSLPQRHDQAAAIGDYDSRWSGMFFDGALLRWSLDRKSAFVFGDLTYSAGKFGYYGWRNTTFNAAIIREQYLRGLGFELEGGKVYLGATENNSKSIAAFISYPIQLIERTDEKLMVQPSVDAILGGGGRHRRYTMGAELQYSKATGGFTYGVSSAGAMMPFHGKTTYTFLAEPSFAIGDFSLAGTWWRAFLANPDSSVQSQVDAPDEEMFYIEPSVSITPKFSLGFPMEMHDPARDVNNDETYFAGPSAYLYPTANVDLSFWTGYSIRRQSPNTMSVGINAQVAF